MSSQPPRTRKQPAAAAIQSADTPPAVDEADNHLAKGRYREAIDAYKKKLKQERRPEWLDGLAAAYAGRAQALVDKGMRREAITLWQNRAELCGKPLWEGHYADWLVAEGKLVEVLKHLSRRYADNAPDETLAALETRLAPALLAADAAVLAELPPASLLVRHHPSALAAVMAYSQPDAAALDAALAAIPFRSPYRDLRPLLKSMRLLESDVAAARATLERLPVGGPFERLAAPLRVAALPPDAQLPAWAQLSPAQQRVAGHLIGMPPALSPLLQALAAAGPAADPETLFDLLLKHCRHVPAAPAHRLWQQLAPWSPKRIKESLRLCGEQPQMIKDNVHALAEELNGNFSKAEAHWEAAAQQYADSGMPDGRLRAALILRHRALDAHHLSRDNTLDDAGADLLARSLEYDVYDRDAHAHLIAYWRQRDDLKKARAQLDFALVYFPDDTAILAEAVATALASGAFKKAATSARRLLELDPLNPQVRVQVGHAHLSHAGKQIAAGKPDAARSEIDEAAQWLNAPTDRSRMLVLRAWTYPAGSSERQSFAREAIVGWGGDLAAGWRLLREAQDVFPHGKPSQLLQDAGIDSTRPPTWADLIGLSHAMETAHWRDRRGLDTLGPWRKAIGQLANGHAINAEPEATDTIRLCEAMSRHREYGLLEKFAEKGRQRWPQHAVFVYYAVAARFEKRHCFASDRDYDALESAHRQAHEANDRKLVLRIDALFDADEPPEDQYLDVAGIFDSATRSMLKFMLQNKGETAILKMAVAALGASLVGEIEKHSAGNRAVFLERLIDALAVASDMSPAEGLPFGSPFKPIEILPAKKKASAALPQPGQGKRFDD